MEDIPLDSMKGPAVIEEDDRFYEDIEAPKFVDLTVPDWTQPEDSSWFCVRVGCDQNHEVVDPDALHRSFVLRVMAARSPNVRLRRTVNQQAPRSLNPKCPHSAPAKSAKGRVVKFSRATSIPERIANTKTKDHPISSLRSTPRQTKAKLSSLTSEKALTTPRSRRPSAKLEPFRSVKHQRVPIVAPRNGSVAKALFLVSPKKTAETSTTTPSKRRTPVSEICAEMKKLKLASLKDVPRKHPSKSRRGARDPNGSAMQSKKKNDGSVLQEAICGDSNDTEISRETNPSIQATDVEDNLSSKSLQSATADSTSATGAGSGTQTVDIASESDDNKENLAGSDKTSDVVLNTTSDGIEKMQSETHENIPAKVTRTPGNAFEDRPQQGQKHKRTTNPKPFRLRTDERGILKEANLERRLQNECHKETALAHRKRDLVRQNGKSSHEHENQIGSDKGVRNAQLNRARIDQAKMKPCAEINLVSSSTNCQKVRIRKEKLPGRLESRITKVLTVKTISAIGLSKAPSSRAGREKGNLPTSAALSEREENSTNMTAGSSLKGKRPVTVPKQPMFHKMHVPKGCTKRPEIAAQ